MPTGERVAVAVMLALVVAGAGSALVGMHKTGAATVEYADARAEQLRLLKLLEQDLRRAITPPQMDLDDQGMRITVADTFRFAPDDPLHRFPIAVSNPGVAASAHLPSVTGSADGASIPTQTIVYRFAASAVLRTDPWQPLVASSAHPGTYVASGPATVACVMDSFPTIKVSPGAKPGSQQYTIWLHSLLPALDAGHSPCVFVVGTGP